MGSSCRWAKDIRFRHSSHGGAAPPYADEREVSNGVTSCRSTALDRGRDAGYPAPPAQIRTGPIKAYGLYGAFLVKGARNATFSFFLPLLYPFFCSTAPQVFFRPDRKRSKADACNGGQGRRFFSAAGGLSLTDVNPAACSGDRGTARLMIRGEPALCASETRATRL
jgi:hypothetical protein